MPGRSSRGSGMAHRVFVDTGGTFTGITVLDPREAAPHRQGPCIPRRHGFELAERIGAGGEVAVSLP